MRDPSVETPTVPVVPLLDRGAELGLVAPAVRGDGPGLLLDQVVLEPPDERRLVALDRCRVGVGALRRRKRRWWQVARPVEDGKPQLDRLPVDERRPSGRRRPGVRPVGAGEREPYAVSGLEDPRRRLELDLDLRRHAGLERRRGCRARPVGQVEDPARDERGRAVGEDVAELRRQERDRVSAAVTVSRSRGVAHHVQLGRERLPVVDERERVVGSLVVGLAPRQLAGARDPGGAADVAANVDLVRAACPRGRSTVSPSRAGGQVASDAPFAAHLGEVGSGPRRASREHHDRRLLVDPVLLVAQPAAEPADQLGHEVDVRARAATSPATCGSTARSAAASGSAALEGAERVVAIAVGPAGDDHRRARDPLVARAERAVPPVRRRPPAPRASGAATARCPRSAAATRRASRRRTRRARAAARCTPPCRAPSRRDRPPSARRPCSGRRRCSGRRWRRSARSPRARGAARRRPGSS